MVGGGGDEDFFVGVNSEMKLLLSGMAATLEQLRRWLVVCRGRAAELDD